MHTQYSFHLSGRRKACGRLRVVEQHKMYDLALSYTVVGVGDLVEVTHVSRVLRGKHARSEACVSSTKRADGV